MLLFGNFWKTCVLRKSSFYLGKTTIFEDLGTSSAVKLALERRFQAPFDPGMAFWGSLGRQVGPGPAVWRALGRQVGSGTAVLGALRSFGGLETAVLGPL